MGAAGAIDLDDEFLFHIVDFVIVACAYKRSFVPIEGDTELRVFEAPRVPTPAFPCEELIAKIVGDYQRIGRLLVVIMHVLSAAGANATRIAYAEPPPADVQRVEAVLPPVSH